MNDAYIKKTVDKVFKASQIYEAYLYKKLETVPMKILHTNEEFRQPPSADLPWKNVSEGDRWGGNYGYAWLKGCFTVQDNLVGKELWLKAETNAAEALLFVNGRAIGLFDRPDDMQNFDRVHLIQPLTFNAELGECFNLALEAYAGHSLCGVHPYETTGTTYPQEFERVYKGVHVVEIDKTVHAFLRKLCVVRDLYDVLDDSSVVKGNIINALEKMFACIIQMPESYPTEVWHTGLEEAIDIMEEILANRLGENESSLWGEVGLIGHSHLDTAWLWPVSETVHKAARTFSNALTVMKNYPEYTFIQSSVLYLEWMRKYYPYIYEEIKQRTAEGRWEPNGGAWVECDGNMVGGEYLIRQFLRGQLYLRKNLNYQSDCFWEPDTFGYSPAIPQILLGCGIKYFLTTKLSWNEANTFPYDTFIWRGIDGSQVLTHFNLIHCWPSAKDVFYAVKDQVRKKNVTNKKLLSYGFGDGGGGPSPAMVELAREIKDLAFLPKTKHTTVSEFMKKLEAECNNLPVYDGELYLELHRGTLTQIHDIKRSNRKAEIALHNLELISVHSNALNNTPYSNEINELTDILLLNQFHDILPGTTLSEVHDEAVRQNYSVVNKAKSIAEGLLCGVDSNNLTVYNPLSWVWDRQITIEYKGFVPKDYKWQRYTDLDGNEKLAIAGIVIPPLASATVLMVPYIDDTYNETVFEFNGQTLNSPFAAVHFTPNGAIESFIDKSANRELVANQTKPINTFYMGDDVPTIWDNWDVDYDQRLKMKPQTNTDSIKVVSIGALQCRIRIIKKIGQKSELKQDIIFYSDNPRVDFETIVDWHDIHSLLKVSFPVNVRAVTARHETQFGNIERPTTENNLVEKAKFEVCNHRFTDLSETRYGVALLNDCKYGISVDGNDMSLTLHKGGCHPDPRGDVGVHSFTYSLLPHNSGFSADTVVRGGYELNNPPIAIYGEVKTELYSFAQIDAANVIIETIKQAENGRGFIIRLYEAECNLTNCALKVNVPFADVYETNMLEDISHKLIVNNDTIDLKFKPFEIKTLYFSTTGI